MQKTEVGNLFLKEFVRQMILNSSGRVSIPIMQMPVQMRFEPIAQIPSMRITEEQAKPAVAVSGISGLQNIKRLISNPSITSIECPGPDKNIIVNQNGKVMPMGIKLNEQEIAVVMNEFSEKTKIPLIRGVFKARLGNFAVTAVISDYVGTRFLIQRMGPMVY